MKSPLSKIYIATSAFFWLLAWHIFLHPYSFSPYASLYFKWVSYGRHIVGSCFLIHCDSPCILIGIFTTLTFKVIIDMVGLTLTVFATCFLFVAFVLWLYSISLFLCYTLFLIFFFLWFSLSILYNSIFFPFLAY